MRKQQYTYSPYPVETYRGVLTCTEVIDKLGPDLLTPVWNLLWLSKPVLDGLLDRAPRVVHSLNPAVVQAIVRDVQEDPVLRWKLVMHPTRFIEWFRREDHSIYDCYDEFGGDEWVYKVLGRACEAQNRLAESAHALITEGNVTYARFGGRAA